MIFSLLFISTTTILRITNMYILNTLLLNITQFILVLQKWYEFETLQSTDKG